MIYILPFLLISRSVNTLIVSPNQIAHFLLVLPLQTKNLIHYLHSSQKCHILLETSVKVTHSTQNTQKNKKYNPTLSLSMPTNPKSSIKETLKDLFKVKIQLKTFNPIK